MPSLKCLATIVALIAAGVPGTSTTLAQAQSPQEASKSPLELTRAARPWEFIDAVGNRSALFGDESGKLEAWVYPLKILRNFHLRFKFDNEIVDAKNIARTVQVRPEGTSIVYVWDTFRVTETLVAPVDTPGALILLDIDAAQPVEVEAVFDRDFQLEWPAPMGDSDMEWTPALHAFSFEGSEHKFSAIVGSPTATQVHAEFSSNYASLHENAIALGKAPVGKTTQVIAIAASFQGLPAADVTYKKLCTSYAQLTADSASYYQAYLDQHLQVQLPDKAMQSAYEWAQISTLQGLVNNPYLGTGLVAGYDHSSDDQRPGYGWFFGRDALWTSLALNAEGDFATTRKALEFLMKYQRKDGKITHEISQGASFVPWFDSMPYAYAAADATPLLIIAMDDYVRHSGDVEFAREHWDNIWRAHQFVLSTYDPNGFPKNDGVGHGWVEGGPLLPVKGELYQASLALESIRTLASIAHAVGKPEIESQLVDSFKSGQAALNKAFWIESSHSYAFALDAKDAQVDTPSVLATVPMWFGLLDHDKAESMIELLDGPEAQTSWGMRIIPSTNPKYDAAGYHSGSVWPLFTGWASVGEYRYHQALPAYANLRANSLLTFDGSLGHVTEVLSGDYYQTLASASPHQIWSSAMVIAPLLRGMFGLDSNALANHIFLTPHLPASWTWFALNHVKAGQCDLNIRYDKTATSMTYSIEHKHGTGCTLDLAPAVSLRAQVDSVDVNGKRLPFQLETGALDQHVHARVDIPGATDASTTVTIHLRNDFGLYDDAALPSLGSTNEGLRVIRQTWSDKRDALSINVATAKSGEYDLGVWSPAQIASVDGAKLLPVDEQHAHLRISITQADRTAFTRHQVVIHFNSDHGHTRSHKYGPVRPEDTHHEN